MSLVNYKKQLCITKKFEAYINDNDRKSTSNNKETLQEIIFQSQDYILSTINVHVQNINKAINIDLNKKIK